jgi:cytochrome c5
MVWPFNWRFLQLAWRILFFDDTGPYKPDPHESIQWNRGAYLVDGLGHCAMCHTPSYHIISENISLGAPIRKYNLTGANIQGYLAPNITKTNLGGIPDNQLLEIFTNYRLLGGAELQGPMLEAVHDSLIHLSKEDLLAMIIYLKTLKTEMPPQPNVGESGLGEAIYNSYCSGCHSTGVGGAPKIGDAASWGPLARSGINKLYAIAINGGGNMPARGTCITCSDYDIKAAVDYMVAVTMKNPEQTTPINH